MPASPPGSTGGFAAGILDVVIGGTNEAAFQAQGVVQRRVIVSRETISRPATDGAIVVLSRQAGGRNRRNDSAQHCRYTVGAAKLVWNARITPLQKQYNYARATLANDRVSAFKSITTSRYPCTNTGESRENRNRDTLMPSAQCSAPENSGIGRCARSPPCG